MKVAEGIISGFQLLKLGTHLGIDGHKIELGKYNAPQLEEATAEILMGWKGRFHSKAEAYQKLVEALGKMGRKDLVKELEEID